MRVFVDTNIVIDVLARREPFYDASRHVLDRCQSGLGRGLLSTLTFANSKIRVLTPSAFLKEARP